MINENKIVFVREIDLTKIQYETHQVGLKEVIEEFTYFLKGCGYEFHELEVIYKDDEK